MSMLQALRELVCALNKELPTEGLVTMTSGNVSGRDPETNLVAIKPSGVSFAALTPADIVIVDLQGNVVYGTR
jgi:L-ribulose-5-phosphate 4-epimerase